MNEVRLVDFRAESLQFDINHQYTPKEDEQLALALKLDQRVRMSAKRDEPTFLNIRVTLFDDSVNNNYPFEIVADVTGVFLIDADGAERETLLKEHGLNTLLPFIRAMIGQLVSLANLPTPVILPPLSADQLTPAEPQQ